MLPAEKPDRKRLDDFASALTVEHGVTNPRMITKDMMTRTFISFGIRIAYYRLWHGFFVSVILAFARNGDRIIPIIIKLFEQAYEPSNFKMQEVQKRKHRIGAVSKLSPLPQIHPILPPDVINMASHVDVVPEERNIEESTKSTSAAQTNYLPQPKKLTQQPAAQGLDPYSAKFNELTPDEAVLTRIFNLGAPFFVRADTDGNPPKNASAYQDSDAGTRKAIERGEILSAKRAELAANGLLQPVCYEYPRDLISKINDAVGELQNSNKDDEEPGLVGKAFNYVVDRVTGGEDTAKKVFNAIGAITAANTTKAIGFFPIEYPLGGVKRDSARRQTRKEVRPITEDIQKVLTDFGKTIHFSDKDIKVVLNAVVHMGSPSLFRRTILQKSESGGWELYIYCSEGVAEENRKEAIRMRAREIANGLIEFSKGG
ncbi:MAG: hypothetical protein LBI34_02900 [Puniceicoccales bacterium]|jgi:hypothetical protein|nr:hypothetical protein [Puniceicoccales bacterium]